jgi:hypothetical protein
MFKAYSCVTLWNAISLSGDLKLGYYTNIPPRVMLRAQMISTLYSVILVSLRTSTLKVDVISHELAAQQYPWTLYRWTGAEIHLYRYILILHLISHLGNIRSRQDVWNERTVQQSFICFPSRCHRTDPILHSQSLEIPKTSSYLHAVAINRRERMGSNESVLVHSSFIHWVYIPSSHQTKTFCLVVKL